ncbi:phospholipase DDHD2-like isoform X2 [Daphnia carinata]|uniref:phospholipase DDHD2-like isoform X2 n=1 Tax=Daphnia carinata TaxID=120202 RepID=UPI00257A7D35|nr:phospholipase DDHD2-like isoform X2 [Daphnia carinata]
MMESTNDLDVIELTPTSPTAGIAEDCPSPAQPEVLDAVDGTLNHSYQPVVWHWFFLKEIDKTKRIWKPFSMLDSVALDETFQLLNEGKIAAEDAIIQTDGGRYDVDVGRRLRTAIYWEETPLSVRRCSWFFKGSLETRYTPYDEDMAEKLEEEYYNSLTNSLWRRVLEFPLGNKIMFQNPNVLLDFSNYGPVDDWTQVTEGQIRPLIVKRGIEGYDISDGEKPVIDHLIFLVHGIGSVCDLRFRNVVEVVDDFRILSFQMLDTHFPTAVAEQRIGRVEFLPVSWHAPLHGDDTGIDKRLRPITLPSIPKLRHFANDTILDVLFYTSPVYCETIISTVAHELNRLYKIFLQRNPTFEGQVSLGGHSLGSLILFDLLAHQPLASNQEPVDDILDEEAVSYVSDLNDPTVEEVCQVLQLGEHLVKFQREQFTFSDLLLLSEEDLASLGLPMGPRKRLLTYLRDLEIRRAKLKQEDGNIPAHDSTVSYTIGLAGTGQPSISYPLLDFHPAAFYALGSPTAMFVTVRGIDRLGEDFVLPTCPKFYNIFHPYDPVAYRFETLIDVNMVNVPPVLIPHHKGRKRMHIELRETMARFSADIKEKFFESFRSTWSTVQNLTTFRSSMPSGYEEESHCTEDLDTSNSDESAAAEKPPAVEPVIRIGKLNGGCRIDYVLQEAPLESFNEYLFALTSHVVYWESEDTMLMMLRETYAGMDIYPDK